ncbi:MAG: CtsR family transcriptional regulator [Eubacteriales bacterium]|nr:CtsR family transcriptional regulator [Eubacteriales bacterium]
MASLSDLIEKMLKEMMEAGDGAIEINRNELAQQMNCAPSQITYVLTTRFTNGQGYYIESRRGGGGSIRIRQLQALYPGRSYLMHLINALEELSEISQHEAQVTLNNCQAYQDMDEIVTKVMWAAVSDRALQQISAKERDRARLSILKNMLLALAFEEA